ncbi:hypothetical protein Syun_022010 [Stephania yunnanensis]|uniref:Kinesin motor domain-containing protein n=1 Tax=Stephania yunnanensis TaxID=152371 RepID=A0AAP0IGU2_9MAGN
MREIGEDGALRVGLVMSFDGEEKQWSCERSARSIRNCGLRSSGRSPNRIDCSVDPLQKFRLVVQKFEQEVMDFLKNLDKYTALGAKLCRDVIEGGKDAPVITSYDRGRCLLMASETIPPPHHHQDADEVQIGSHAFTFDHVYSGTSSSSYRIFEDCISPLVDAFFNGYNATVLAYGQNANAAFCLAINAIGVKSTLIIMEAIPFLVLAHLDAICTWYDPTLKAVVVTCTEELAYQQAKEADNLLQKGVYLGTRDNAHRMGCELCLCLCAGDEHQNPQAGMEIINRSMAIKDHVDGAPEESDFELRTDPLNVAHW